MHGRADSSATNFLALAALAEPAPTQVKKNHRIANFLPLFARVMLVESL